jgi:hypothetical protein
VITVALTIAAFPSGDLLSDADTCQEMHARTIIIADRQKYLRNLISIINSPLFTITKVLGARTGLNNIACSVFQVSPISKGVKKKDRNNRKVHADRLKANSLVGRYKSTAAESFQHLFQGRSFKPLRGGKS